MSGEASLCTGVGLDAGASEGEGAGSVVSDGVEAKSAMADAARAGRVGDIGGAGGAHESVVGEAGKVSNSTGSISGIIASDRIEQAHC